MTIGVLSIPHGLPIMTVSFAVTVVVEDDEFVLDAVAIDAVRLVRKA